MALPDPRGPFGLSMYGVYLFGGNFACVHGIRPRQVLDPYRSE